MITVFALINPSKLAIHAPALKDSTLYKESAFVVKDSLKKDNLVFKESALFYASSAIRPRFLIAAHLEYGFSLFWEA